MSLLHFLALLPTLLKSGARHPLLHQMPQFQEHICHGQLCSVTLEWKGWTKRGQEKQKGGEGRLAPNHSIWVLEVSSTTSPSLARSLLAGCLVLMGSLMRVFQEKQMGVHLVLPLCGLWHLLLLAPPFITYVVGYHKFQEIPQQSCSPILQFH